MKDDAHVLNAGLPQEPPKDPASQPLPPGLYQPQNIVDMHVETNKEDLKIQDDKNQILNDSLLSSMPESASENLYLMGMSQGTDSVIISSGSARVLNLMPSSRTDEDYTMLNAIRSGVIEASAPPPSVDLRADWWDINDQGNSGACVGFGTCGVLRYLFTKTKALGPGERLSASYVWMAAKETDEITQYPTSFVQLEGTTLKAALNVAQRWGVVRESLMPFGTLYTKDAPTFFRLAAQMRISSYYNLGKNITNWKQWLASSGPILAAINVDETFQNTPKTGLLNVYDINRIYGGHCICFVGYTKDNRIIIRNSWGTGWGDGGFAYASVEWIMKACLEAYGAVI